MNVSDLYPGASASQSPDMPHPPLPSDSTQTIENARAQAQPSSGRQSLNSNRVAPSTPTHQRIVSGSGHAGQEVSSEMIPERESSMRRKPVPSTTNGGYTGFPSSAAAYRDDANHPKGPRTPLGHKATRSIDADSNGPSRLVPHFTTRSPVGDKTIGGAMQHKDLRLPASFDLSNTERTFVDTNIVPAVTQENVHIKRTELVTKVIHKDVHIDHHYTYVQPIPVLEILPARHFRLDPVTGMKTEIAAPPGYKLPAHLEPRQAEDYSHLKQTNRHYVVDEDHPHGQLESAPTKHGHVVSSVAKPQTVTKVQSPLTTM